METIVIVLSNYANIQTLSYFTLLCSAPILSQTKILHTVYEHKRNGISFIIFLCLKIACKVG